MINIAFDEEMMREAIAEGKKAAALGEAPIGAVIVQNGVVLSRGHNRVKPDETPWRTPKLLPLTPPAGGWAAGAFRAAPSM